MSEVIIDKITGNAVAGNIEVTSEGGAATFQLQQGLAKHWVYLDMGTPAVNDSLNTSSVTDTSTGVFDMNISNPFDSANYSIIPSGNGHAGDSWNTQFNIHAKNNWGRTNTGSTYELISYYSGGAGYIDGKHNYVVGHGDLA